MIIPYVFRILNVAKLRVIPPSIYEKFLKGIDLINFNYFWINYFIICQKKNNLVIPYKFK
jgi:hypothetical protein